MPELSVRLGSLPLKSPVICGAGEHVADEDALRAAIDAGAAAVVAKSANESEDARRQWEVREHVLLEDGSLFNRSGLVPVAWDEWLAVLARADAHARERDAYVVASIIPADADALPRLAAEVESAGLRWLELNLSAPHASESRPGSVVRADTPEGAAALTAAVREAVSIPVTVKLSGDGANPVALATTAHAAGADHVALIGRHMGFVPDLATRAPVLGTFGGIGGAWALPLTMRWIAKTRLAAGPSLPIVGTNGARDGGDVARLLLAGADHVALIGRHMGFVPDLATRAPVLGTFGGIGGAWALPLTMRWIAKTRLAAGPSLPIVGTNGARDGGDVARLLLAGATAAQVATSVIVEGFDALGRITGELSAYLAEQGLDAGDLVGAAADAVTTYEEIGLRSGA